ncbi:hypothetical protein G7Z99_02890 [Pseudomonas entomophila]|uniref:hypothetical protein n=1 Tax=Pseudomonas entomophila TaxID=312306 RepID=UPI0015E2A788|nr:hypothetical protein [Pseudomonas entomophila]MBA1187985.1 hypothetical protein [Pseudomonas entomophila]
MTTPEHRAPTPQAAQRQHVITELQQVIERVPEETPFTNSTVYKIWGPVAVVGLLVLLGITLLMGRLDLIACCAFLLLGAVWVTWQHRQAGRHVFMRLTRRQLFVDTLDGPVDLAKVEHIEVDKEAMGMLKQTLHLSDADGLPTHRVVKMQAFCNQALVEPNQAQVRILSAGLASGGRTLNRDEVSALLGAYRDAAQAQQRLDELQRHG